MSPDDERHGTNAGYRAHFTHKVPPCDACREAGTRARKRRAYKKLKGQPGRVPAIGSQRRIQALIALGWTQGAIAAEMGLTQQRIHLLLKEEAHVFRSTADSVAEVYERLSMSLPEPSRGTTDSRKKARRNGWPPPLAWPEGGIDDPDCTPMGWQYVPPTRAERVDDLDEHGATLSEVLRALKVNREALERWCARTGRRDTYHRLVSREGGPQNQWTREAS